jgi:hypothetical protein
VLFCASPALAQKTSFGEPGEFIVSADRLFSLLAFSDVQTDEIGAATKTTDTSQLTAVSLFAGGSAQDIFFTVPRVGLDYVIGSHLTLGGELILYGTLGRNASQQTQGAGSMNQPNPPTVFLFGAAPRVGYLLPLTEQFAFWPRGGISWYTESANGPDSTIPLTQNSVDQLAIDLDPQFVWSPVPHFGITAGPTLDIPIAGGVSTNLAQGTTATANSSILFFGLTVGMLGYL